MLRRLCHLLGMPPSCLRRAPRSGGGCWRGREMGVFMCAGGDDLFFRLAQGEPHSCVVCPPGRRHGRERRVGGSEDLCVGGLQRCRMLMQRMSIYLLGFALPYLGLLDSAM